jgi:hypothetical protein
MRVEKAAGKAGSEPMERPNVIILTPGLSGSSVLTGLVTQAGYWAGDSTFKKEYDTYENLELVNLNKDLLAQAGCGDNYTFEFSQQGIDRIAVLRGGIVEEPYRTLVEECNLHRPWVWKDPRLWLTIRFWAPFLPLDDCKFILLTRHIMHSWTSSILRRRIVSFGSLKRYENSIQDSILSFLGKNGLSSLHVTYEDLIARPDETIEALNAHLNTKLTVDNLRAIYRGPLYKVPRNSPFEYVKAAMIYLKNYPERAST